MSDDGSQAGEPLPCPTIIFRSVFHKWLEDDGEVSPAAFMRTPKDLDGLSTFLTALAGWSRLGRVKKVQSLHAGRTRDIDSEIDVEDDPADDEHAVIVGLPWPHEDDEAFKAANRIATCLLKSSRPVKDPRC